MQKYYFIMMSLVLLTFIGCTPTQNIDTKANGSQDYTGTYHYTYEHNTETLVEDHYIVLDTSNEKMVGWYYGTSDEFDFAREGYYPGFFVLPMKDLEVSDQVITFTLELKEGMLFEHPIDLTCLSLKDIDREENPHWTVTQVSGIQEYSGSIVDGKITLNFEDSDRIFEK
ncbi:MAG: hypothetical protein JXQ26_02135 [Tissierellales bacterium]|nr:hypothetical protein [Tissierellales bacterium]